ncbi:MAG TPA: hypothetical protein VLX28_00725 [Thermoanaerobaculia bacterium]|nr:hypothetical protein [Thermoanaerobaculia bacterium]
MKRALVSSILLAAVVVLTGCNGTVSSVSFPPQAPWNQMATGILSPTDDLVATAAGTGIHADLVQGTLDNAIQALVSCQGSGAPYVQTCDDRACDAQATCGTDTVIEKRFTYVLLVDLDRGTFSTGSVQIVDGSGATQAGLAINAGNAVGGFDVAAGYSEGLIPGVQLTDVVDEAGALLLSPHWSDFGGGDITGQVCPNGVCSTQTIARCDNDGSSDGLAYQTVAQPGTYSGTCGTVPVHLTINPPFKSLGDCISTRKAVCNGLTGQNRKTCNNAQIGMCQAMFNKHSAHNPN